MINNSLKTKIKEDTRYRFAQTSTRWKSMMKWLVFGLALVMFNACNLKKIVDNNKYIIKLSDSSKEYEKSYIECIKKESVIKLIPYFFSENEQNMIKEKGVKKIMIEITPYITQKCNGLYLYSLHPDKLIKRSHPISKSSFIILDGELYPASQDTIQNHFLLKSKQESLSLFFNKEEMIEIERVYNDGFFAIWGNQYQEEWYSRPFR
jgi:hypothetical protein